MVIVYWSDVFMDDYGITVSLDTNLGAITFCTNFPRRNKWITLESICAFEIKPGVFIEHLESFDLHVRDTQLFIHKTLMRIGEDALYENDEVTKRVISNYRREHNDTI